MAQNVKFKIQLDTDDKGVVTATVDTEKLKEVIGGVETAANKASKSLEAWAQSTMAFNALSDLVGKLNGQIQAAAGSFNDFDKSMRAANTMAGLSEDELQKMKDSISELSKDIPKTRAELADGLYAVISNGVSDPVEALKLLETSARASVGGIADLTQVIGVTSTVMKNYGITAEDAAGIQDKIQLTAKNGVTSFEQLAAALPAVSGNAATLGVSVDELLASFATLTGVSGNTAAVSTQLGAIFTAMVKPSSEAAKMAEEMGIKFDAATIKAAGGFKPFLQQLKDMVSQYSQASGVLEQEVYGRLFGSAEALKALIPLQGELADKYVQNVGLMTDSSGTMDEAFEQMSSTGEAASIMLNNLVSSVTDCAGGIASALAPTMQYVTAVGDFGTAIGGIYGGMKTFISAIKEMELGTKLASVAQTVYNAVMSANPIALVVLALAALGAAFAAAYSYCEPFATFVDNIWQTIKNYLTPVFEKLGQVISKVFSYFNKLLGYDGDKKAKNEAKAVNDEAKAYDKLAASMAATGSIKTGAKPTAKKGAPSGSLSAIDDSIKDVQKKISLEVDPEKRAQLYKELENLKNQKVVIEAKMQLDAEDFKADTEKLSMKLENTLDRDISKGGLKDVNAMIKQSNKAVKAQERLTKAEEKRQAAQMNGYEVTQLAAQGFGQMGEAIGGAGGQMVQWAAQQVAAIAAVIPQIVALITAKEAEATAEATASGSSLPFPANIAAIAASVATVIATFAKMPKFANGGIISGPTIGLMGEYSGASNNPEVVAPLSKLKSMLGGDEGGIGGKVVFKQRGRDLYGVLARENRFRSRQ